MQRKTWRHGTWLITEVDASIALQMGVQAGYDFSWLREIPGGALKGDIGLRVQMGASAVFGFEAAGKYAVVVARESDDQKLRVRLYKLAKKGWNFALDARVGIKAQLPAFFDRGHHPEDLVAAIFGLNENQIIDVLRETRAFVNSNVSLQDKLAGVLMKLGGKALDDVAGLSPEEIRNIYETGRQRLVALLERFDKVLATGGHELTSLILSLSNVEVSELKPILRGYRECDRRGARATARPRPCCEGRIRAHAHCSTDRRRCGSGARHCEQYRAGTTELAPPLVSCSTCSRGTRFRSCSTSFASKFTSIA